MGLKSVSQIETERLDRERQAAEQFLLRAEKYKAADEITRNKKLAETYLNETIPKLIESASRHSKRSVIFPHEEKYTYDSFFSKESEHGRAILDELQKLGYTADIVAIESVNYSFEDCGESYSIVSEPGTHTIYRLVISW